MLAATGIAAALAIAGLTGCAKMDAALGQQQLIVQFNPNTSVATARHVIKTCSHVPNLRPAPVRPTTADRNEIDTAQYNATNASDANMAQLQICLQRFPSVQSVNLMDAGDS